MKPALKIVTEPAIAHSFSVERPEQRVLSTEWANRLNDHRILVIESGTGSLKVDDTAFELRNREIFLLSKGQIYQFEGPAVISGYVVSFGDCFWDRTPKSAGNCKAVLFNNAAANQRLQPDGSEMEELVVLFHTLFKEYESPPFINQMDVLAAYLKIIMIKLANINIREEGTFDSQDYVLYREFMELLSDKYRSCHAVSDYADLLHITARRLSELCRRCSNKTAKEMINGQIIAEAKRSLQFSSSPVKEIAYQLHFSTPEQFSHFFRKHTHIAPADYRDQFINMGL